VATTSESLDTEQDRQRTFRRAGVVAAGVVLAVAARVALFGHESFDYRVFFKDWYEFISTHGGFSALKHDYLAEVLTVIAAFFLPRRLWYVPFLVQTASFLAYLHVLFPAEDSAPFDDRPGGLADGGPPPGGVPVPGWAPTPEFRVLAALMAVAVASVLWAAFREFRHQPGQDVRNSPSSKREPPTSR
jgi:hypothetical protein